MAATNWSGNANLGGATNLGTTGKMRQKSSAEMTASGQSTTASYTAAQLATLVATFDAETNAATKRDTLARLVAYCAAAQATSVNDRSTPAHVLKKIFEDADRLVRHLYGFFGPAGLIVDRPSAELLWELEGLVGSSRAAAGKEALPGTSY